MAEYKSRRERRRAGGAAEKPHHGMALIIAVAPKKKKKAGGWVEGEKARSHLGRRARGGRAHRADGGDLPSQDDNPRLGKMGMRMNHVVNYTQGGGDQGKSGIYDVQEGVGDRSHPPQNDDGPPVRARGGKTDQPIDQVMSYRTGGEIERTPSGSVKASARHKAEDRGETMKGGSFPIRNAADLANAKHDVGRAKNPSAARHWINKRAKELGEPPLGG